MTFIINKIGVDVDRDMKEGLDNQPKQSAVYDDFSFPVSNLRVNWVTSKPDYDQNEIEYLFASNTTETVVGAQITKHSFKSGGEGNMWFPHIHWGQATAGVVKWQLEYKIWCANTTEPGSYTVITTTDSEFPYTSGVLHQVSSFTPIDLSIIDTTVCIVKVKVSRLGGDAEDTYPADARFQSFDFHVLIDQLGSRQEFIK